MKILIGIVLFSVLACKNNNSTKNEKSENNPKEEKEISKSNTSDSSSFKNGEECPPELVTDHNNALSSCTEFFKKFFDKDLASECQNKAKNFMKKYPEVYCKTNIEGDEFMIQEADFQEMFELVNKAL